MRHLFRFYVAFLVLFLLGKVAFVLYNLPGGAISLSSLLEILWHGLPLDLATAAYMLAPYWLCTLAGVWVNPGVKFRNRLFTAYVALLAPVVSLILVGDTVLYGYWGFKLDATVWNYLAQPKGIVASVTAGQFLGLTAVWIIATGFIYFGWLRLRRPAKPDADGAMFTEPVPGGRRWGETALLLVTGGLLFLAIRGGVGKSTANVGMVYFSQNAFYNHAAVNPAFSLLSSTLKKKDYGAEHRHFSQVECRRIFDRLNYDTKSDGTPMLLASDKPNVLLILMEGCGGLFVNAVDSLANPDITPRLNALAREGVLFSRCYGNSFRTDRGMVCALSGYPSFPDVSVMKLPGVVNRLPGIAASLKRAGYSTQFLYGGDINFTGTNGYLLATGYERTYGDTSFPMADRRTHDWGVTDHIAFRRLLEMTREAEKEHRPWHIGMLTLASHEPWRVPYNRIPGDKVANGIAYLDSCIGDFMDSFRKTPAWNNTLVVLLPDHGIGYGDVAECTDPRRNHIPLLFCGGAVKRSLVVDKLCNQSDLPATLLGQLRLPHDEFRFSRDILSRSYTHPTAVHTWSEGMLYADTTGYTVVNFVTRPHSVVADSPRPSASRLRDARAFLQTAYCALAGGPSVE